MSRYKRRGIIVATLLIGCVAAAVGIYAAHTRALGFRTQEGQVFAATEAHDEIVARVNGEPVMLSQVSYAYLTEKVLYDIQKAHFDITPALSEQFAASTPKPDPERTLNVLINGAILAQEVKRQGSEPDKKVLDELLPGQQALWHQLLHPETRTDGLAPMSLSEFNKVSGFVQDVVEASGLTEAEAFEKYAQSSIEGSARLETFRAELERQGSKLTIDELKAELQSRATIEIIDRAAVLALSQGNP